MKTQANAAHNGRKSLRNTTMTARQLMTADPETVTPETHLVTAASRMAEFNLRHLPVVDEDQQLVGILSDRDLRTALGVPNPIHSSRLAEVEELTVASVMSANPIRVELDATVKSIAGILATEGIGAVPVVDEYERVVGIVSYVDVLAYYAAK